jgi:hypothetical protein
MNTKGGGGVNLETSRMHVKGFLNVLCFWQFCVLIFVTQPLMNERVGFRFIQSWLSLLIEHLHTTSKQSSIAWKKSGLAAQLIKAVLVYISLMRLLYDMEVLQEAPIILSERG